MSDLAEHIETRRAIANLEAKVDRILAAVEPVAPKPADDTAAHDDDDSGDAP